VLDPESLSPGAPSYLAAVSPGDPSCGLAFLDLSTGRFLAGAVPAARIADAFALFRPREVLLPDGAEAPGFAAALSRRPAAWWNGASEAFALDGGLADAPRAAAAAARAYAEEVRPGGLGHVLPPAALEFDRRMGLDAAAIATLELFESSDGSTARSLCAALDRTKTPIGARALREALAHPSLDPVELEARWDAVEELVRRPDRAEAAPGGARKRSATWRGVSRASRSARGALARSPDSAPGSPPYPPWSRPRLPPRGGPLPVARRVDPRHLGPRAPDLGDARARAAGARLGGRGDPGRLRRGARRAARAQDATRSPRSSPSRRTSASGRGSRR
jgi:DNA mismatch repair protein MutS